MALKIKNTDVFRKEKMDAFHIQLSDEEYYSLIIEERYHFFCLLKELITRKRFTYNIYKILRKILILFKHFCLNIKV